MLDERTSYSEVKVSETRSGSVQILPQIPSGSSDGPRGTSSFHGIGSARFSKLFDLWSLSVLRTYGGEVSWWWISHNESLHVPLAYCSSQFPLASPLPSITSPGRVCLDLVR